MLDKESISDLNTIESEEETETEYDIMIRLNERTDRRNKIKNYVTKNKAIYDCYDNDSDEDQLGGDSNYQLNRKELSLQEREYEEELELTYVIEQMNLEKKEEKVLFDSSDDNNSNNDGDDNNDDIHIEHCDYIKFKTRRTSQTDSNYTKDSVNTVLPENQLKRECFISQNIVNYQQVLKTIVIGKTSAGKSLFIQKLLQQDSANPTLTFDYTPTASLEINKTTISLRNNYRVNLELWDTCTSIVNSELIKTYYKLANGFILIADIDSENGQCDISFISKQIQRIFSISSEDPRLFLLINTKGMRYDMSNDSELSKLVSKYYLQVKICDLSRILIKTDEDFLVYLNTIAKTKKLSFEKTIKNKYYSSDNTPSFKDYQHKSMPNQLEDKAKIEILVKDCSPFNTEAI